MPSYDDEDFLDLLDTEKWASCLYITRRVRCTFQTTNRRLIQLAEAETVEIADPENDQYGIPENENTGRPILYYRKVPDDRDPLTGEIEANEE